MSYFAGKMCKIFHCAYLQRANQVDDLLADYARQVGLPIELGSILASNALKDMVIILFQIIYKKKVPIF